MFFNLRNIFNGNASWTITSTSFYKVNFVFNEQIRTLVKFIVTQIPDLNYIFKNYIMRLTKRCTTYFGFYLIPSSTLNIANTYYKVQFSSSITNSFSRKRSLFIDCKVAMR